MEDWLREEAGERSRQQYIQTLRGFRRWAMPLLEVSRLWAIVISSGVCVGIVGAWLDILSRWFSDLREGRCSYGFFYNRVACCTGIDGKRVRGHKHKYSPEGIVGGEVCTDWLTWSQYLGVNFILLQSLLQAFLYILLAVSHFHLYMYMHSSLQVEIMFSASSAFLVKTYAPYAFHTGSKRSRFLFCNLIHTH